MILSSLITTATLLAAGVAQAAEIQIGKPVERNGMEIGAVYLQPVMMEPMMPGMSGNADVHLEADIRAQAKNPNGFGPGEWVPYLGITYRLEKIGSDWSAIGAFMAMVANDGPHYGANVKLDGPGKYRLTYHIAPPPYQGFYRHTDKETGVAKWWAPFDVSWEFAYVGVGKKGGY
ncbi:MAG: iron transporter [Gammaproteobacteria bacterium]